MLKFCDATAITLRSCTHVLTQPTHFLPQHRILSEFFVKCFFLGKCHLIKFIIKVSFDSAASLLTHKKLVYQTWFQRTFISKNQTHSLQQQFSNYGLATRDYRDPFRRSTESKLFLWWYSDIALLCHFCSFTSSWWSFPEATSWGMTSSCGHLLAPVALCFKHFCFISNMVNIDKCILQKQKLLEVLSNFQECGKVLRPKCWRTAALRSMLTARTIQNSLSN